MKKLIKTMPFNYVLLAIYCTIAMVLLVKIAVIDIITLKGHIISLNDCICWVFVLFLGVVTILLLKGSLQEWYNNYHDYEE